MGWKGLGKDWRSALPTVPYSSCVSRYSKESKNPECETGLLDHYDGTFVQVGEKNVAYSTICYLDLKI